MRKKALIAMSGGVDSSVAAYLMKEAGYDCIGATMRLHDREETACGDGEDVCRGEDQGDACQERDQGDVCRERDQGDVCRERDQGDVCRENGPDDARKVAEMLEMPFYVFDCRDLFREKVMEPFTDSYLKGYTPNPCIECNRHMKFEHLYQCARKLGCDLVVTGHYARIIEEKGRFHLLKGKDKKKDQSYVLYALTQKQLARTHFPLGDYSKKEIREIAERQGFSNAHKGESQDICFIPDGNYPAFIEKTTGLAAGPGDFVDQNGDLVGRHKGYYCYTIGQRRGLGISAPAPYYVTDIIPEENKVILGSNEDLFRTDLLADDFNWIEDVDDRGKCNQLDFALKGRIRYHQTESELSCRILGDGKAALHFLKPQRAITRGQALVLYQGDYVVGGGRIIG